MSPTRIIIILIGLVAAIAAALLLRTALSSTPSAQVETEEVLVSSVPSVNTLIASRDLRIGEIISPSDMRWVEWPENMLRAYHIVETREPEALQDLVGHIVRAPLYQDEPISREKIVSRKNSELMSAVIGAGNLAVAVEISEETASGGFILPNDRVNVILTHTISVDTDEGEESQMRSDLILENVRVLAIDQVLQTANETTSFIGTTATLEMAAEHAKLLALAENKGVVTLGLRSMADIALMGDEIIAYPKALITNTSTAKISIHRRGQKEVTAFMAGKE